MKINSKAFAIPILTETTVQIGIANALGFIFHFLLTFEPFICDHVGRLTLIDFSFADSEHQNGSQVS